MSTFNLADPMETMAFQLGVKSSDNGTSSRFAQNLPIRIPANINL
jgi:hypothetical protein